MSEPKQLKTLQSMSLDAYNNSKKQKQIKNWYKQYGIIMFSFSISFTGIIL